MGVKLQRVAWALKPDDKAGRLTTSGKLMKLVGKPTLKLVLLALADAAHDHDRAKPRWIAAGTCWPKIAGGDESLSSRTGLSERTIKDALDVLAATGWIARKRLPYGYVYTVFPRASGALCAPLEVQMPHLSDASREFMRDLHVRKARVAPEMCISRTPKEPTYERMKKEPGGARLGEPDGPHAPLAEEERLRMAADMAELRVSVAKKLAGAGPR